MPPGQAFFGSDFKNFLSASPTSSAAMLPSQRAQAIRHASHPPPANIPPANIEIFLGQLVLLA
jgi:hypothetical protein